MCPHAVRSARDRLPFPTNAIDVGATTAAGTLTGPRRPRMCSGKGSGHGGRSGRLMDTLNGVEDQRIESASLRADDLYFSSIDR